MNPNTRGFENPCIKSAKSSASMARRQNSIALSRSEKTEATHPPSKPMKSMIAVSKGSMVSAANTRGTTNFRLGSVPIARIASTCSVTSIEPSSDAIPVAQRPVTSSPVNAGPNSRTSAMATTSPVRELCPNRVDWRAGLQHHHRADKKSRQQDDRHRSRPDKIHLDQRILHIIGADKDVCDRASAEYRVVLHGRHGSLGGIRQQSEDGDVFFVFNFATGGLERSVCHSSCLR